MIGIATTTGWLLLAALVAATGAWGALALSISGPQPEALRTVLAAAFALASVAVLVAIVLNRRRWHALTAWLVLFLGVLAWWATLRPSNDRDWLPNVARLPWASVDGNIVTVHNIRNFAYRSENDFTPAWYDKPYDLSKLEGIDVIAVYWMGPDIAHVFVSFAFAGGDHLAVSIETRTEKGEGYSTVKGFFRQYELYYVVADERDVIGLRTNYRHDPPEDVYVYRVKSTPRGPPALLSGVHQPDQRLKDKPEFYNTPDDQLHHQHLGELAGQSGPPAVQLEDPGQRPCPGIPLRERGGWTTAACPFRNSSAVPTSMPARRPRASRRIFRRRIRRAR